MCIYIYIYIHICIYMYVYIHTDNKAAEVRGASAAADVAVINACQTGLDKRGSSKMPVNRS